MTWVDGIDEWNRQRIAQEAGRPAPDPPRGRGKHDPTPALADEIEAELGDLRPPDNDNPYVEAGVEAQIRELAGTLPGGRNTALFVAAKALGRLADVDRRWLRGKLKTACELNGYTADDGMPMVNRTIKSGLKAADDAGERVVPDGPGYFATVTEVSPAAFRLGAGSSNGSGPSTAPATATDGGAGIPPIVPYDGIFELEGDFWERDSLAHIFDAALMRMTPPWGVLAHCVARVLYLVPPKIQLPPLIGGNASLNWFGAVTAPSGQGKSTSGSVAAILIKGVPDNAIRPMGSGEGIAAQYRPPGKNPDDQESLIFQCEEISTFSAMNDRQGSTTTATLCNAFMGDPLGHSYVKTVKIRALERHAYRMTLIMGVQPGLAGPLLDDQYSGILQRFQWFPAFDSRCIRARAQPGELLTSLNVPQAHNWLQSRVLAVPPSTVEAVLAERERSAQGRSNAIEGHMLLVREIFAFALALIDDRTEITEDDWRLAGVAMQISRATRDWVERQYRVIEADLAGRKGTLQGHARLASDEARADLADERVLACARWAYKRLRKVGPQTNRELQRSVEGKLGRWFNGAIAWAKTEGHIEEIVDQDGVKRWSVVKASKQ